MSTEQPKKKVWGQETAEKYAAAGYEKTTQLASAGYQGTKQLASAGYLASKNIAQAFYAKHKLDGVLLILITIIILVIAIVDISHATLSWDPKTPDDKARHRDRSITLMTFALLLVVFTIIKQFFPKLLGISPVPAVAAGSSM